MSRAPRIARAFALAVLATLASCGREHDTTTAPAPPPPPEIEAFFPAARSRSIFTDTQIWAQFHEPLDPATVNTHTVFLKHDTQRLTCTVSYEAATRRIRVTPAAELALRRTYTVELTPAITTSDGTPLSSGTFWQFTTIGVRVPGTPYPENGAIDESPSAALLWAPNESGVGPIAYDVYIAPDSESVASHAVTPQHEIWDSRVLANPRWAFSSTLYWSVTAHNLETGESTDGPVWRFSTLAEGTPIDSLLVPARHWEYVTRLTPTVRCFQTTLNVGPSSRSVIRWDTESVSSTFKLAGARMQLAIGTQSNPGSRGLSVLPTTIDWPQCEIFYGGPPFADPDLGTLATASIISVNNIPAYYRFTSDALTSHVEASIRHHRLSGYLLGATIDSSIPAPITGGSSTLMIYYYRLPEPTRARHTPTTARQ